MSSLWEHYEKIPEKLGSARCTLCNKEYSYKTSVTNLKKHLLSKHSFAYQNIMNHNIDDGSENDQGDNDTYTEMVYLEDETEKNQKPEHIYTKKQSSMTPIPKRRAKKRKISSSSDEYLPEKSVDDHVKQMEIFSTYITLLLKQMPNDVCTKLQMDIISLIMAAKLKVPTETHTENKVVFEGVPVAIQNVSTVSGTGYIVTVPNNISVPRTIPATNKDPNNIQCVNTNANISVEEKIDPLTHDNKDMPALTISKNLTAFS